MNYYLWFLLGVVVGSIITNLIRYWRTGFGVLRIDHSNPEKDVYRFMVDNLEDLPKKKRITLKIDNNADLSQK